MSTASLRVLFAGTPPFAAKHLEALIDSKHQLIGVYTQPDRPAGRGKKLQASAVKVVAENAGLAVFQPASLKNNAAQEALAALRADVLIVVAYGLILPPPVLVAPRFGCLNVHASLLPRWRGAAPIQRAIEAGDSRSGVTIMQMDAGLDTGDILHVAECPIGPDTTAASLHDALAELGPPTLLQVLDDLETFQANRQPQPDTGTTYAHKITKQEAAINWALPAADLEAQIRAFNPFPVSYSTLEGERVRVWRAVATHVTQQDVPPGTILDSGEQGITVACAEQALVIQKLQLPGGKQLDAAQVLHARQALFAPGKRFSLAAVSTS